MLNTSRNASQGRSLDPNLCQCSGPNSSTSPRISPGKTPSPSPLLPTCLGPLLTANIADMSDEQAVVPLTLYTQQMSTFYL